MTLSRYISELENAIITNKLAWFPMNKNERKTMNLRLGRELGYGLGMFSEWLSYAQTSYGRLVVKNSFDSVGVVISNKEWISAIKEGIDNYNARQ